MHALQHLTELDGTLSLNKALKVILDPLSRIDLLIMIFRFSFPSFECSIFVSFEAISFVPEVSEERSIHSFLSLILPEKGPYPIQDIIMDAS